MFNIDLDFGDGLIIGFIIILLIVSVGGFMFAQSNMNAISLTGDSMHPNYQAGCNIAITNEYNSTQTIEKGDVIVFNPDSIDTNKIIFHRVLYKYDSFSYEEDTTKEIIEGEERNIYSIKLDDKEEKQWFITYQSTEELQEIDGKTAYVTKGDNNTTPDPEIVTNDDILYTVNNDYYFHLSDDEELCSETVIQKLVKLL